jgi:hypothetical protein
VDADRTPFAERRKRIEVAVSDNPAASDIEENIE